MPELANGSACLRHSQGNGPDLWVPAMGNGVVWLRAQPQLVLRVCGNLSTFGPPVSMTVGSAVFVRLCRCACCRLYFPAAFGMGSVRRRFLLVCRLDHPRFIACSRTCHVSPFHTTSPGRVDGRAPLTDASTETTTRQSNRLRNAHRFTRTTFVNSPTRSICVCDACTFLSALGFLTLYPTDSPDRLVQLGAWIEISKQPGCPRHPEGFYRNRRLHGRT